MALCVSSNHIFVSDGMSAVKQIRIDNGQLVRRIILSHSSPNSICISPDEQFLYVAYSRPYDDEDDFNDIDKYRVEDSFRMPMNSCKGNHICISNDGQLLFVLGKEIGEIQVVDAANGNNVQTIYFNQIRVLTDDGNICLSPDGNNLFAATMNQISILDVNGGERILQIPFFSRYICVSEQFIFASDGSNLIRVLRINDGSVVQTIPYGTGIIDRFCISPDENEIFTVSFMFTRVSNPIRVFQI